MRTFFQEWSSTKNVVASNLLQEFSQNSSPQQNMVSSREFQPAGVSVSRNSFSSSSSPNQNFGTSRISSRTAIRVSAAPLPKLLFKFHLHNSFFKFKELSNFFSTLGLGSSRWIIKRSYRFCTISVSAAPLQENFLQTPSSLQIWQAHQSFSQEGFSLQGYQLA